MYMILLYSIITRLHADVKIHKYFKLTSDIESETKVRIPGATANPSSPIDAMSV